MKKKYVQPCSSVFNLHTNHAILSASTTSIGYSNDNALDAYSSAGGGEGNNDARKENGWGIGW